MSDDRDAAADRFEELEGYLRGLSDENKRLQIEREQLRAAAKGALLDLRKSKGARWKEAAERLNAVVQREPLHRGGR